MKEISLHILDLAQNSITAGAREITIAIDEQPAADTLSVVVGDNGHGMDPELLERVQSPFATSRTTRKVGLGIPLFRAGCLASDGDFSIRSQVGQGTWVTGRYRLSHIDRPPLGDMAATLLLLITANPELDFHYSRKVGGNEFDFSTQQARAVLADVPLDTPEVHVWLNEYLAEAEKELNGGA